MSIRLGIYDFFAYTIPGGFYLLALLYVVVKLTPLAINIQQISLGQILIFGIVAYVAGIILDNPVRKLWYKRFQPQNLKTKIIAELNARNDNIHFPSAKISRWILLGYIKHKNMEMAVEIERINALQIMLRNVSFALLIFALLPIIDLAQAGFSIWQLLTTGGCLFACYYALKQALRFDRWFHLGIYETIAALRMDPSSLPITFSAPDSAATITETDNLTGNVS